MAKDLKFIEDSLESLRAFPEDAKRRMGYQLRLVQEGDEPTDWKPMPTIGAGVREIRVKVKDGAYRTIYVAKFEEAIYVLHAFKKKTQKTAKRDIDLATGRYKELIRKRE